MNLGWGICQRNGQGAGTLSTFLCFPEKVVDKEMWEYLLPRCSVDTLGHLTMLIITVFVFVHFFLNVLVEYVFGYFSFIVCFPGPSFLPHVAHQHCLVSLAALSHLPIFR